MGGSIDEPHLTRGGGNMKNTIAGVSHSVPHCPSHQRDEVTAQHFSNAEAEYSVTATHIQSFDGKQGTQQSIVDVTPIHTQWGPDARVCNNSALAEQRL
jgi:hypothetical protein